MNILSNSYRCLSLLAPLELIELWRIFIPQKRLLKVLSTSVPWGYILLVIAVWLFAFLFAAFLLISRSILLAFEFFLTPLSGLYARLSSSPTTTSHARYLISDI